MEMRLRCIVLRCLDFLQWITGSFLMNAGAHERHNQSFLLAPSPLPSHCSNISFPKVRAASTDLPSFTSEGNSEVLSLLTLPLSIPALDIIIETFNIHVDVSPNTRGPLSPDDLQLQPLSLAIHTQSCFTDLLHFEDLKAQLFSSSVIH